MKKIYQIFALLLAFMPLTACIYDFSPEELDIDLLDKQMLVIEGDIIPGDYTYVYIYESLSVDSEEDIEYIKEAQVWVEDKLGQKWSGNITVDKKGFGYAINTTSLDMDGEYKLCADVPGRGLYESELMPVMVSPEIDSLTFSVRADSTELYVEVTTHNMSSEPLYCKWDYISDWEFKAYYIPEIYYTPATSMYYLSAQEKRVREYCWGHELSSDIYVGSTESLSENLLYKQRLNTIHYQENKLNYLYSTLVRQMALDKRAYDYWSNLKRSSADMGGIFAPQPSEVIGNISCKSNPQERVLGYINVSTVTTKRLYITNREAKIHDPNPNGKCNSVVYHIDYWPNLLGANLLPIDYDVLPTGSPDFSHAFWTADFCADCRIVGSKEKPSYWPNDHK